jgi:hypothetical protein
MKKAWRIIIAIVLVAILLGSIGVGVGLITGGDINRVITTLDERYHPAVYYDYAVEVVKRVGAAVFSLGS